MYVVVFCCFSSFAHGVLFRSKKGCSICGRKTDSTKPFINTPVDVAEKENVCNTFNVKEFLEGEMCSLCARAIRRFKTTGVKAPTVSITIHVACRLTNEVHKMVRQYTIFK